jgi:hypothetical protein
MSDTVAPLESASWALLTPVPPGASVLWVGPAGRGVNARLSLIFGQVTTCDFWEVEGAAAKLAAPEASMDLIVFPGGLGDLKRWGQGVRPREAWGSLLRASHALLKPGGHVFLAVENRWALPRASGLGVARRWLLASLSGYRSLLVKTGFSPIRMWCAFPDCEDSKFLVECRQQAFDHFLRVLSPRPRSVERNVIRGALNAVGALKYTARWYWILGRRDMSGG